MSFMPFMPDVGILIFPFFIKILKHGKRGSNHKSHMHTFFAI